MWLNKMAGISPADLLTYSRFVLTTLAAAIFWNSTDSAVIMLLLIAVIYLTDFLDGKVARLYAIETPRGALLDVLADFYFILIMHILFVRLGMLPYWYTWVIIWKCTEFIGTSYILSKQENHIRAVHDPLGRGVALVFYLTPTILIIMGQWEINLLPVQLAWMASVVTILAITSSIVRFRAVYRIMSKV